MVKLTKLFIHSIALGCFNIAACSAMYHYYDDERLNALLNIVEQGNLEEIKLAANGAETSFLGISLCRAALCGIVQYFFELLEHGANVHARPCERQFHVGIGL